jgi:hypothetical protein
MALSPVIVEQLARLGAARPKPRSADAVAALVREVVWPDDTFTRRPGEEWPLVRGLRFLPPASRGQFWDGWEQAFASVDPTRLFPLASDNYYFYFVADNDCDPSDPLVYCVDHEESDAEPYGGRFRTVSELLSAIEAEQPAK